MISDELSHRNTIGQQLLNTIMANTYPSSISKIASMLNESESNIKNAIVDICYKLDDESAAALLGELM